MGSLVSSRAGAPCTHASVRLSEGRAARARATNQGERECVHRTTKLAEMQRTKEVLPAADGRVKVSLNHRCTHTTKCDPDLAYSRCLAAWLLAVRNPPGVPSHWEAVYANSITCHSDYHRTSVFADRGAIGQPALPYRTILYT